MLSLEILVPDGVLLQTQAAAISAVDRSGSFGLRPGHEPFCAALAASILTYRDAAGIDRFAGVDRGVLLLEDDHVTVATRDAVLAPTLDEVAGAAEAMIRTRQAGEREAAETFARLVAEILEQMPQLEIRR